MTRVAFVLEGTTFQGSANYFRNLFSALALMPVRAVEPYVFVGRSVPDDLVATLKDARIVSTPLLDPRSFVGRVRRRLKRHFDGWDPLMSMLLRRHGIEVLSHSGTLRGAPIKTVGWIPDFQHTYLPNFFDEAERGRRDAEFRALASRCDIVVLSSAAAQDDLRAFAPEAIVKSRVLRFVPSIEAVAAIPLTTLASKYAFEAPYFYMPNQFWIHKNHRIVIEALAKLKAIGLTPTVVMTGSTQDYRHPSHYDELLARAAELGVAETFKVLGMVPYGDLLSLMQHSVAVLNPSLFEGWSSSVEEAKALDKTIVLSNLPVHLEQDPRHAIFFDPADADGLARAMREALDATGGGRAPAPSLTLSDVYETERRRFAETYSAIIGDLAGASR